MRFGYRFIPWLDFYRIQKRPQDCCAQQPLAHWRLAGIEGVEESHPVILARKKRLDKLEIPHRHLVQFQCGGVFLKLQ